MIFDDCQTFRYMRVEIISLTSESEINFVSGHTKGIILQTLQNETFSRGQKQTTGESVQAYDIRAVPRMSRCKITSHD